MVSDFSTITWKSNAFKIMKQSYCQPSILCPIRLLFNIIVKKWDGVMKWKSKAIVVFPLCHFFCCSSYMMKQLGHLTCFFPSFNFATYMFVVQFNMFTEIHANWHLDQDNLTKFNLFDKKKIKHFCGVLSSESTE